MILKIGDVVSYHELTGKVINIFNTPSGNVVEVECPSNRDNDLDVMLWVPESEILNSLFLRSDNK
jgi:ribosomal 30S subunit maturation factor RimM